MSSNNRVLLFIVTLLMMIPHLLANKNVIALRCAWEYDLSTAQDALNYLASTKCMSKEEVVLQTIGQSVLVTSHTGNNFTLAELIYRYKYSTHSLKKIMLYYSHEYIFHLLKWYLQFRRYQGDYLMLRIEVAPRLGKHPLIGTSMLLGFKKLISRNVQLVFAWASPEARKGERMYTADQIRAMTKILEDTRIDLDYYIYIEADLVLASNTLGLRGMFPNIAGLILTTSQRLKAVYRRINFFNLYTICNEFGFAHTYIEINDTRLRHKILHFVPPPEFPRGFAKRVFHNTTIVLLSTITFIVLFF